jgi:hypothetical protein
MDMKRSTHRATSNAPKPEQAANTQKAVPPPTSAETGRGAANPAASGSSSVKDFGSKRFPGYAVHRQESGIAKMSQGERSWEEPQIWARITDPRGRTVERNICLNSLTCCIPGGPVRGVDATDEQLLEAVLGDESVFGPGRE